MNKLSKKVLLSFITILGISAIVLSGCGKNNNTKQNNKSTAPTPSKIETLTPKTMFSSSKPRIAFKVQMGNNGISIHSRIRAMTFSKNNTLTMYLINPVDPFTLGQASKMSTSELLKYAREQDRIAFEGNKKFALDSVENRIGMDDFYDADYINKLKSTKDVLTKLKYKEFVTKNPKISAYADNTGNNISLERVYYKGYHIAVEENTYESENDVIAEYYERLKATTPQYEIYNKHYAGFLNYASKTETYYWLTDVTKNQNIDFDTTKTKGIELVDVAE